MWHRFRATGITTYLQNGGTLEHAQQIAAHESPRTTKHFKIGHSVSVVDRAKLVTPNVNWERSSAIMFHTVREAINCERTLHWLFRAQRLSPLRRDGGTEFFSLDCLPLVAGFISANQNTLGFQEVKSGDELRREWKAAKKVIEQRRVSAPRQTETTEQREASNKTNAESATRLFSTLESLKNAGVLKGKFLYSYNLSDKARTALLLISDGDPSDVVRELITYGQFSCGEWGRGNYQRISLFGDGYQYSPHQGLWIQLLKINDWRREGTFHEREFVNAARKCFSSALQLIEEVPFVPDADAEAVNTIMEATFNFIYAAWR